MRRQKRKKVEVPLSQPDITPDTPQEEPPRRPRRGRKVGLWLIASVMALVGVVALALFMLTGRPITIPSWISNRAELLLAEQLPHLDISLGQLGLVIEDGFSPRLRAENLELRESNRSSAIQLDEVDISLSFDSLLKRQIAPKSIKISGVSLSLRRLNDGSFNLTLGEGGQNSAVDLRASLANLGGLMTEVLDQPLLHALQEVQIQGLNMRFEDIRAGQGWTIDGGQARLSRQDNNVSFRANLVALGARAYVSSVEASIDLDLDTNVAQFGLTFEDMPSREIASQSPALSWLEVLNAPISGSLRTSTDENGVLGLTAVALQIGKGALQPNDQVLPIPFKSANTYLTYDPKGQILSLDQFSIQADRVAATAQGTVELRRPDQGIPQELIAQLEFTQFEINPNFLENSPVALDSGFADFRLRLDPFELTLGQLVLSQGGQRLRFTGSLKPESRNWNFAVDGSMTQLERDALLGVWPEGAKEGLRNFIATRIHNVEVRDINLAIRSRGSEAPEIYADFQFHDLDLTFLKTLPPLRASKGVATFARNQFLVGAEAGYVEADEGGRLDIAGTGFVVRNTQLKQSPALVRLVAKGPVTAALSLLNRPPLSVMDNANLPVDLAMGTVHAVGEIDLTLKPKLQPEEVTFVANLALDDVVTTHFIPGKVIAGNMTGFVDNNKVMIEGDGTVGKLPVHARWEAPIGPKSKGGSVLTGQAELSRLAVEEFDIGFPLESFSGAAPAQFKLDIQKGKAPDLSLKSDLVGLGVSYPPLGFTKAPEIPGILDVNISLEKVVRIDDFAFEAPGLAVNGAVSLRPEGGLDRATLEQFEVGNWLSGQGALVGRGEGLAPGIVLTDGSFDIRGLPSGSDNASDGDPMGPIEARLQRVQVSESYYLSNFEGRFVDQGELTGTFSGRFNGGAPVTGEMLPGKNGALFRVESSRGGDIMTEIGLARTSGPGRFTLRLEQAAEDGEFDGRVTIRNVRVLDAPAFAELLNAVSVIGLLDQLNGPGISLTEVSSRFRVTPSTLFVTQGSAVGPAMGISLDGTMDMASNVMKFQGVFSPVYVLNAVGRVISKKGEGLVGFNYFLDGTPDDYNITVNPLSALTPGFLREIFRVPNEDMPNTNAPEPAQQDLGADQTGENR